MSPAAVVRPSTGAARTPALPGVGAVGLRRIGYETRAHFRVVDHVFFSFLFPVMMFLLFAAIFGQQGELGAAPDGTGGISFASYYLTSMLAAGLLLSGTQTLAIDIAIEKHEGTLARLGNTPMSPISFFIGKLGQVFVTGTAQAAVLVLVAVLGFGVQLPTEPGRWLTFAWLFLLGTAVFGVLGIALSALPRSGKSATAVVLPPVLILQFISGVYLPFSQLPDWLQQLAALFPLKWLAEGMRGVFLPEHFAAAEPSGVWDCGLIALVLGGWLVLGLVVCLLTFRWQRRG
ncbi:ABC transporter permease [Leucobacter sp. M11]|uniref:ABC transporter permease n=1 Tax=Leucobacter sp. M11 TaxID=2993565 RepID=UPI002D8000FB|nr:ABC transporter permease [Leucobacter sp. M11]MEB4614781.1 ABC transporter permease [Leucobacter sp. M11]